MAQDRFFTQTECDRCGEVLSARTMSWFTHATICMTCAIKEQELKSNLRKQGKNPDDYEGCGYIPKV